MFFIHYLLSTACSLTFKLTVTLKEDYDVTLTVYKTWLNWCSEIC